MRRLRSAQAASTRSLCWGLVAVLEEQGLRLKPRLSKALLCLFCFLSFGLTKPAYAQTFGCATAMANDIVCENSKPGNPDTEWDISGDGDLTIQGFATDISVNQGGTIFFKIDTDASAYTIDIYRLGYYGGNGARKIASITPSAKLPQNQPACITDNTTNLADCGNWAISASWQVPSNATSGAYIAHLVRSDTGGDSHIAFIVRNDASDSDILFQTADETWQAYNFYGPGGFGLYGDNNTFDLPHRAFKVSYNRPFITREDQDQINFLFYAEFAMIQWLEQNGYDVTYSTGLDAARNGSLILNHKLYMSTGHDEYWSGPQRSNVEAARNSGVNLAFFSGNEVFWKTRWENSIDGTNTPYRTLVCYKETLGLGQFGPSATIDPEDPPTWTGTWRDPSFSPPADGGRPENSLTGTLFMVNGTRDDSITVTQADGRMRFWRNTSIANLGSGQSYTTQPGFLGYEWDVDADNGFRPAGLFDLSTTTVSIQTQYLLDYGANYGAGTPTHHLTLYRAPSGALVFGAGTVQWAFALDSNHDDQDLGFATPPTDPNLQQATVNLFADMRVQPATLQSGLVPASASTDHTPPVSTIAFPASGSTITTGTTVNITGTATDTGGGVVGGVEVSLDGGTTWHPASGRESWSYPWTPTKVGAANVKSRAVDDSGNLETPSAGISLTAAPPDCPCNGWSSSITPSQVDSGDPGSVEVGVKFRADYNGYITGIRFYKSAANTGTHLGNLWTTTGTLLASATFTNETASGWQQVNFNNPVAINANTTYIASYFAPVGHYSATDDFFALSGLDAPPIDLLQNGVDGPNGVFNYSSSSSFPTSTYNSSNYWVDVVFMPAVSMPGAPPALLLNPSSLSFLSQVGVSPASQSVQLFNEGSGTISWTASTNASWLSLSASSGTTPYTLTVSVNSSSLASGTYTGTITINASGNNLTQTITVSLNVTNLLLSTNYSTQGLQGWTTSSLGLASDWTVINQLSQYAIQFSGGGNSQIYAGNSAWTNYTVNVPIKLSNMSDYPGGIRGRVNPATGAGYMLWLYPALGEFILYRSSAWDINQPVVQIGSASAAFDTANFHNVSLVFNGSQIQVMYDGKTIITATDSTYTNGLIALEGFSQVISFGNVLVTGPNPNTGSITSSTSSLSFSANFGGPRPTAQAVQVSAGGGGTLVWTAVSNASWLSASPSSGTTPANLQMSVNSTSLGGGTFNGTITVVALGATNSPQIINVSLTVITPPPSIIASPASVGFAYTPGQPTPSAQTVIVANGGYGGFSYTVSTDSPWLSASPTAGSVPGSISVSVNASGLAVGPYAGHVIITAAGIANSPQMIPVTLDVLSQDLTETFSDLGTGWILSPMGNAGGWSVSYGVYAYSGAGLSQSCTGNGAWSDYTFDTNIKLSALSNWPGGVRARVNPSTGAGYAVWLYPGYNSAILYRIGAWNINDPSLTQLAQTSMTFDTSSFHDLGIDFSGSNIYIYWDGKLIMSAEDNTYAAGFVCMDGDSQPVSYSNVRVSAVQSQITLANPPSSVVFSSQPGTSPAPQTINVTAGGAVTTWAAAISGSAPWLSISASTTFTPGVLTISANPTGMAEGTYTATIILSAPGAKNSPIIIPVILAVHTAVLSVKPATLSFFGTSSLNPTPLTFQVSNLGTGNLGWAATATSNWIGLNPTAGTAPSTITVSPNTSTLANGSYSDTISISSPDVGNSPATISVSTMVGTLLFSDNFSSGAGNWTISPLGNSSGWSVGSGTYNFNGQGETNSWAGSSAWTDYTVAVDFKLATMSDWPGGLRGRVNASTGSGYGVWIYPAQGYLILYRIGQWDINAQLIQLGQPMPVEIDTVAFHNLRLSFQGSTISVYYDNVLVGSVTDSTYALGAIALDGSYKPISFANVRVISLP